MGFMGRQVLEGAVGFLISPTSSLFMPPHIVSIQTVKASNTIMRSASIYILHGTRTGGRPIVTMHMGHTGILLPVSRHPRIHGTRMT